MIHLPASVRVYLCLTACDMRKSFDGLHQLVRDSLTLDAFAGHLFVFASRRRGQPDRAAAPALQPSRAMGCNDSTGSAASAGSAPLRIRTATRIDRYNKGYGCGRCGGRARAGLERRRTGRGKSELHRARCLITSRRGDPTESATENKPLHGQL